MKNETISGQDAREKYNAAIEAGNYELAENLCQQRLNFLLADVNDWSQRAREAAEGAAS